MAAEQASSEEVPNDDGAGDVRDQGDGDRLRPGWLAVGERVVMQPHGIGEVVGNEVRIDVDGPRRFVVVRFESGVRVLFPDDHAASHLRPVISAEEAGITLAELACRGLTADEAQGSPRRRASHRGAALVLQRLYLAGAYLEDADAARLVAELEALVLREIGLVLDRPLDEVRRTARGV